jgi:hypothetical protein
MIAIGRGPRAELDEGDPLALLAACHERIRRFAALAIELCGPAVGERDRAEAAAAVARYFGEAMPLHVDDEERDLEPRIARRAPGAEVFGLLGMLARQHRRIEAIIESAMPAWRELAAGTTLATDALAALAAAAASLADACDEHLGLEERELWPRAREHLDATDLAAIAAAMRARRSTPGSSL